jgi:hypothetical protein
MPLIVIAWAAHIWPLSTRIISTLLGWLRGFPRLSTVSFWISWNLVYWVQHAPWITRTPSSPNCTRDRPPNRRHMQVQILSLKF